MVLGSGVFAGFNARRRVEHYIISIKGGDQRNKNKGFDHFINIKQKSRAITTEKDGRLTTLRVSSEAKMEKPSPY